MSDHKSSALNAEAAPSLWGAVGNTLKLQSAAPPLTRAERNKPLPLSFAQQRLWFLQQADPSAISYNLPFAWRLRGPLNVSALEQTVQAIVHRHENFRTTFVNDNNQPVQVVSDKSNVALTLLEVGSEEELHRRLRELIQQSFDLTKGPLLRPFLLRISQNEHVLLWLMHHIVCDGSSLTELSRELQLFYQGFTTGKPAVLPELPVQYADFAAWQRTWLKDEILTEQLAFWKKHLGDRLPVLELPSDHTRPSRLSFRGALHFFQFSEQLSEAVQQFKKQESTTVFNVLLAAFKALLFRYTGQEDLLVGVPTANRNRSELRQLIGFFVNTLVLRTQINGDLSFRQLLGRVKNVSLEAFSNQDVPFDRLVEELKPERSLSHTPVFQAMFSFQSLPRRPLEMAGLQVQMVELDPGTAKFDLTLDVNETPRGIVGFLEYSTDLFTEPTIQRICGHLQNLLTAALQNPDQPLWSLPMLSQTERQQLVVEWNSHTAPYPQNVCLHQLFEAQAARTPEAIALVDGERRLTYAELNARANQLAHFLRKLGLGPDLLAGLCLHRSAEMVIGMLGIQKAGGAYVPLDPAYPADRLSYTLQDAKAPVLLTEYRLLHDGPAVLPQPSSEKAQVVCLDTDWAKIAIESTENPVTGVQPRNLAYVLYTSGSTGRPKGVAIEHRSAVAFAHWAKEVYSPEDFAGVLFATSICFDLSIFESFVNLAWGGKVILAENALDLPNLPAKQEVTLINTVPSAMAELVRMDAIPPSVRTVNLAGEPLAVQLVDQIYRRPHIKFVYDLYGPTEDTTYSTFTLRKPGKPATIGRPLVNKQVFILDPHGQPVPIGVAGELHVAGPGLARGYLNRPELTAEKFIPNRLSTEPGARMYRTGDLARFRANGEIEYLGRIDFQVKIRGFRIELGEIETVLRQHPNLRDVVVVAHQTPTGEKRLVAYLVANQSPAPDLTELRNFIKQKLPDYMVPAAFMFLEALPLTPNGKVDRKALPAPEAMVEAKSFSPPVTATQKELAEIWSELLGVRQIGIQDNFFELGGHSLLATQLISRLRQFNKVELNLHDIFASPTITGLAVLLEQRRVKAKAPALPAIKRLARTARV